MAQVQEGGALLGKQTVVDKSERGRGFSPRVQAFLDLARSTPPEVASDALIRIALSKEIPETAKKLGLLEEAFSLAAGSQYTVKRVPFPGSATDTRSGHLARAHKLNLDTVSLQSRAVNAILDLDPAKARTLFRRISLMMEPLSCKDALTYELTRYYEVAADLRRRAFTAKDRQRGEDSLFIESLIRDLRSPTQVAPIAALLSTSDRIDNAELERSGQTLGGILSQINGDSRSFGLASEKYSAINSLLIIYDRKV